MPSRQRVAVAAAKVCHCLAASLLIGAIALFLWAVALSAGDVDATMQVCTNMCAPEGHGGVPRLTVTEIGRSFKTFQEQEKTAAPHSLFPNLSSPASRTRRTY